MPQQLSRNWSALFSANFLGVFNDNLLKNSIIFFSVAWKLPEWLTQSQLISIVSAALILPYLVFSPMAGNFTLRISKLRIFRFMKLLEIPIMIFATLAFLLSNVYLAVLSVLFMGIQSCFYSPAKYGLVRDIGGVERVAYGSGMLETMAFLGILLSAVTASVLSDFQGQWILIALFLIVALAGYFTTRQIRVVELPPIDNVQSNNPIVFVKQVYSDAKIYKTVNLAVFGSSVFWLIGGMLQMNLVIHTTQVYRTSNSITGIILALAAIGIALGSLTAAKVAGKTTGKKLIIPGLVGMTFFVALLAFLKLNIFLYGLSVFLFAFSGGFFQVPCLATIQQSDSGRKLGEFFAYLNLITFIFVLIGTALFSLTTYLTNQNSYIVFGVITVICLSTLFLFSFYFKKEKQSNV